MEEEADDEEEFDSQEDLDIYPGEKTDFTYFEDFDCEAEDGTTFESPHDFCQTFDFDAMQAKLGKQKELQEFIQLGDLKPSYKVHLIEHNDEDMKKAFEYILNRNQVSLHVESTRKKCSFLSISTSQQTFVFNVNSLSKTKIFQ